MRFYIFLICLFCGVLSGVVYDVFYIARAICCGVDKQKYTVKDKIFIIITDFLYCIAFAAGFIFASVLFDFENLRLYMLLGCALGAFVYLKSFHLIVAFFVKAVYNKFILIRKEKGNKAKENAVGRAKEKPPRRGSHGKRDNFNGNSRRRNNLPIG